MAIDGSTIVVGANFVNGAAGAAYIYTKPGEGTWPTRPTTTLADPGPGGDTFGESVAVDRPHLVVGADQGFGSGGTVYYFTRGPSGWPVTPTTTVADPAGTGGDRFGFSVAVQSNAVVAGAWFTLGTVGMAYIPAP